MSKEWAINLSAYEKKSLIRFLLIYLVSTYIFASIVAFLFYEIQIRSLFEKHQYRIERLTSQVSNRLITSHMLGDISYIECLNNKTKQCFQDILETKEYELALYDINNLPISNAFDIDVEKEHHFFIKDDILYFIDDSAQLHLDVKYVVAKYNHISKEINSIRFQVILGLCFAIIFSTMIGILLARLFLEPIREEIERLNRFIKDSTHELNTPISAILMSIGSLKNIEEKKKKRIELSAKRVASLYQNLCFMLLRDTEKKEEKNVIELKELIEDRLQYFSEFIEAKKLTIVTHLMEKELVAGKESMIKLIDNLLSNAVKYTEIKGTITLELTHDYLMVKDTGIGIKKEMQEEIFKRYKRANTIHGGFGIGLDIVTTICKENNFKINLESKEEKGSTFTIYF